MRDPLGIVFKKNPKIVDFDNKKSFFKLELRHLKKNYRYPPHKLRIKRTDLFIESYHRIMKFNSDDLKGKLNIEFAGEEGLDAGGLIREWYLLVSREVFNANYALFRPSSNGNTF